MKKIIKSIFQCVGAVLLAIVIAALLRFFIVDFYSIPSDSMYPTIEPGDLFVVNKMYMGARFTKTSTSWTAHTRKPCGYRGSLH